ncbi:hypothetical protein XU18_5140 [Perkinsela sp. CCAP 1560/4]|nr:hypothetical protein XU18_5140 [Perkinsela sp. CCAP 1560/4]|eukprot:KNH01772.1 hypothetical protein XU18_5140 [Perkinsela sp. CCAP 1560/4]
MRPSRWYFQTVRFALGALERVLAHGAVTANNEYFDDNRSTLYKLRRFVHTWDRFKEIRSSPEIIDRYENFEFWLPQFSSKSDELVNTPKDDIPPNVVKLEQQFTLTDSDELFAAKIESLLHQARIPKDFTRECGGKEWAYDRVSLLDPLLRRSLEVLRRYGIFICVQSEDGQVFSLSETESEALGMKNSNDTTAFHQERGCTKFQTAIFPEHKRIQIFDAIAQLEALYKSWRGSVVRTGVTFVFTFCRRVFPKHAITLDGCIFISMDSLFELEDYIFSISGVVWSACQDSSQRFRHENANELIEFQNRGKLLAKQLSVKKITFIVTPGTDPSLIDDVSVRLYSSKDVIQMAKEKYPQLADESFAKFLQINFALFSTADLVGQVFTIDDSGILWISPNANVQQVLAIMLRYGSVAVERAKFYAQIEKELAKLQTKNNRFSFNISQTLRQTCPKNFLSCFHQFLQNLSLDKDKQRFVFYSAWGSKKYSVFVSAHGSMIRRNGNALFLPWDVSTEELKRFVDMG